MATEHQKKNVALPHELIEEILLRSPAKSIVRFRSLSKLYLSVLTDPQFIKSHSDLGAASTNGLLYMTHSFSEARWVDIDASIRRYHVVRLPVPYHDGLEMIDSCRGFVLLENSPHYSPQNQLIMWNPLTGAHKKLSYSCIHRHICYKWRPCCFLRGFGYDEPNDDYVIVVGCKEDSNNFNEFRFQLEFFSVRANSWKETAITHFPRVISVECQYGVFFNGTIHWLATTKHGGVRSKVIIAFDLAEKSVSEIPLPDLHGCCFGDLKVLRGCLGVSYWKDYKTKIWVMKEYKVPSTWTKCFSVLHTRLIVPMCFTKGGELVAKEDQKRLVKLGDKGTLVQRQRDDHFKRGIKCQTREVMFTPTLLSLPSDFGNATKL